MRQIYAGASNTIIYLGPADLNSNECLFLSAIRQGKSPKDAAFLESIISKEWVGRVWVFQELVFASNPWVQCGKTRVKWLRLYNAFQGRKDDECDSN
jgi:hypothetical protein